jgi:hypothetical protein
VVSKSGPVACVPSFGSCVSAGPASKACRLEVVFTNGVASLHRTKDSVEEVRCCIAAFRTGVPTSLCHVCAKAAAILKLFRVLLMYSFQ